MSSIAQRELFGGAITADLPTRLIDVAQLREVPDTQEVFIYPDSLASFIVEVLERVDQSDDYEAAKFHFGALEDAPNPEHQTVFDIKVLVNDRGDDTPSPVILHGKQLMHKFNRQALDEVEILLGLFRVQTKNVDLVVSANIPIVANEGGAVEESQVPGIKSDFYSLVRSLHIVDYGLFA
ncbi:Mog1p/PsbP-like protein [Leucogyrophana mollusca]|uniref:Mog1p/PsbP-like protein n=1 Tax=Leucogyrophana mollusca TaxID=85980 RepID=A0ACB8BYT4_9AGAM|nr:Mog1p/PsbP-like protein [Leucogyrophana mollusca]